MGRIRLVDLSDGFILAAIKLDQPADFAQKR
jgi:hypothetical protein